MALSPSKSTTRPTALRPSCAKELLRRTGEAGNFCDLPFRGFDAIANRVEAPEALRPRLAGLEEDLPSDPRLRAPSLPRRVEERVGERRHFCAKQMRSP